VNILTKEAIDDLLNTWSSAGPAAARALAPKYGIKPVYVKKLAVIHKVKAKRKEPSPKKLRGHLDPRWQLAIERGAVVA
jgi:hypothetical protein